MLLSAMKKANNFFVAMVTAPDLGTARKLAGVVLRQRKAACVNLVPQIESHYWWQGKLEQGGEVLMIFKTTAKCLPDLEETILKHHPYDTPEIITFRLESGTGRYLSWVRKEVS